MKYNDHYIGRFKTTSENVMDSLLYGINSLMCTTSEGQDVPIRTGTTIINLASVYDELSLIDFDKAEKL